MALPDPDGLDALSLSELRGLVVDLIGQVRALTDENRALRDELARLKGLPPRPPTRPAPSGMEAASERAQAHPGKRRRRGPVRDRCVVTREVVLKAEVPQGSRFKGYEDLVVRDLVLEAVVIRYRRERWCTPSGTSVVAALPPGIAGGFGPHLRRFLLAAHVQGQVTSERLTAMLSGLGLTLSKRQVVRLLCGPLDRFIAEDQAVLRAGLASAAWISVDDTSARHGRAEGVTTQIGDARFTAFRTGTSKSRLNFLALLRAGHGDFVVNDAALAYMRTRALAGPFLAALAAHPTRIFPDAAAWQAHLTVLGFDARAVTPDPVQVATEGALWGAIRHHGLLPDTVVVSDGAGQFRVGTHALCWVHAERLVHTLIPTTAAQRKAIALTRTLIWWFYADLKAWARAPCPKRARALRARFDRIFARRTGTVMLDRLLARLHRHKAALLRVLERPEIPLHTNGSENDIRACVTKRKISGGTMSEAGRTARDVMLGLMKTCAKLGVSFFRYLG
ncbi:MAG TPA: transposase, partial [Enterovirga sp.]|nr:transposase [Enterovirga sp.]